MLRGLCGVDGIDVLILTIFLDKRNVWSLYSDTYKLETNGTVKYFQTTLSPLKINLKM